MQIFKIANTEKRRLSIAIEPEGTNIELSENETLTLFQEVGIDGYYHLTYSSNYIQIWVEGDYKYPEWELE